jgi:signal transduction histidine kinase
MTGRTWFARVESGRAACEAGLLALVLVIPLAAILRPALDLTVVHAGFTDVDRRWPVLGISMVYAGLFSSLLGAVRLRSDAKVPGHRLRNELANGAAIVFAIWAGALLGHVLGTTWAALNVPSAQASALAFAFRSPALAGASAVPAALAYPVFRGIVLAWPIWNRLRRTRLLWALTHAQFVGSLALVIAVATVSTALLGPHRFGPPFGPEVLPADASPAAVLMVWFTTRLLPALTGLLVLGLTASVVLLPPAALISFLVLRRTTRRLEDLAAATEALRAGRLATRVLVSGGDEVSQLQIDFNAMAADLERTLRDLQAERDRVTGLLEARRQLVATVSHELRTPVTTVRGYLESTLRRDQVGSAELRADLETALREVTRLQRLIEDLFALSRAEVGRLDLRLESIDVGVIVQRLVDTAAPLAWRQRRVQVIAELPPDLPRVQADVARLEQVVSNLLSNAVRHTPPGGLVAAAVSAEADAVRVDVRDTGEGIGPDELPHVFDRFYRGASADGERHDGAGLGLALVKELAQAMGGSVAATSTPGEGSCFTARFPRVQPQG